MTMFFHKNLATPQTLAIKGDEPWLNVVYDAFPPPPGVDAPQLTGSLTAVQVSGGTASQVEGSLRYSPYVDCSTCGKSLVCALDIPVNAIFQPEPAELSQKKVHNLSSHELDEYYFVGEEALDIESLVNDAVHMEVPSRPTCSSVSNQSCTRQLAAKGKVWSSKPDAVDETPNPFGALAEWKNEH